MKYKERDPDKRMNYLQKLRSIVIERGSQNIVYIDESGFEPEATALMAGHGEVEKSMANALDTVVPEQA